VRHGQGTDANTTFRRTRAGLTTKRLVERFGEKAIQFEFGLSQRRSARFAEEVADALVKFMQSYEYLPNQ
jgi:hypothetical protein